MGVTCLFYLFFVANNGDICDKNNSIFYFSIFLLVSKKVSYC